MSIAHSTRILQRMSKDDIIFLHSIKMISNTKFLRWKSKSRSSLAFGQTECISKHTIILWYSSQMEVWNENWRWSQRENVRWTQFTAGQILFLHFLTDSTCWVRRNSKSIFDICDSSIYVCQPLLWRWNDLQHWFFLTRFSISLNSTVVVRCH